MKNGCPECEKLPDGKLCDMCELDYLEWCMETAISDYVAKVNDIIKKRR